MLVAAELGDVDRPRSAPVTLEPDIDQQAGCQGERRDQEYNRASRHQQPALGQNQFDHERSDYRHDEHGFYPEPDVAYAHHQRREAQREHIVLGVGDFIEITRDAHVDLRIESACHADDGGDGERDNQSASVHAIGPDRGSSRAKRLREAGTGDMQATG